MSSLPPVTSQDAAFVGEQRDAEKKEVRVRQRETLNKNRAFMEQQVCVYQLVLNISVYI